MIKRRALWKYCKNIKRFHLLVNFSGQLHRYVIIIADWNIVPMLSLRCLRWYFNEDYKPYNIGISLLLRCEYPNSHVVTNGREYMNDRHLASLREKHHNIDITLSEEENRPFPDDNRIHALKKEKLTLKDQMEHLLQETWPPIGRADPILLTQYCRKIPEYRIIFIDIVDCASLYCFFAA